MCNRDIGNILVQGHRLHSHSQSGLYLHSLLIQYSQGMEAISHCPETVAYLVEAYSLPSNGLGQIYHLSIPLDAPIGMHITYFRIGVVLDPWWLHGEGVWGGAVDRNRRFLSQGFMRPLVVVFALEPIECLLLCWHIPFWRGGGLRLQSPVHSFVPAILLRASSYDPFWLDTQLYEPDRELR